MEVKKWIATATVLTVLWIFVRGVRPENLIQELIIGSFIGFITAYGLKNMFPGDTDLNHWLSVTPQILSYIGSFLKELMVANIDVAKKIVVPGSRIDPDVLELNLRLKNPAAITILSNSITLTPGTLMMDYNPTRNSFYIHGITAGKNSHKILEPILHWEDLLLKIFREEKGVEV
jgi:multicomponent Na+:H+ antiporter subunit E